MRILRRKTVKREFFCHWDCRLAERTGENKHERLYHNLYRKTYWSGASNFRFDLHRGYCTCVIFDLSRKWTGKNIFSVGQHCINCAREALARGYSNRIAFACLLHDASECYLSDVPRPFKKTLTGYKEQEENLLNLIYQKYLGNLLTSEEEKS